MLLAFRKGEADSVHGAGRTLTNLPQLTDAMVAAFERAPPANSGAPARRVVLFDSGALSVAEQVSLYARADAVIGVHGAGFANVLWAPEGCDVVEIVPIDVHLDFQCGLTPFWLVAELLGLRKHAFVAYAGRMFEPFELPLREFGAFLVASGVLAEAG